MKALINTAGKLGSLPESKVRSSFVQYSRSGWNRREPHPLAPENPSVIRDAIGVHIGQHGYTVDELAQVVLLRTDEFREIYGLGWGDQQRLRVV